MTEGFPRLAQARSDHGYRYTIDSGGSIFVHNKSSETEENSQIICKHTNGDTIVQYCCLQVMTVITEAVEIGRCCQYETGRGRNIKFTTSSCSSSSLHKWRNTVVSTSCSCLQTDFDNCSNWMYPQPSQRRLSRMRTRLPHDSPLSDGLVSVCMLMLIADLSAKLRKLSQPHGHLPLTTWSIYTPLSLVQAAKLLPATVCCRVSNSDMLAKHRHLPRLKKPPTQVEAPQNQPRPDKSDMEFTPT